MPLRCGRIHHEHMTVTWLIDLGKRLGRVLFWVTLAPVLMAIDLAVMVVTLDRDRLGAVPENLRYSVGSFLARHRRHKSDGSGCR